MSKSKTITFGFAVDRYNLDIEGTVTGTFTPGSPAVMYLRNGDPGYPADPAEFEPEEIIITDIAGQKLAEPIVLDAKGHNEFCEAHDDYLYQSAVNTYEDAYDGPDDDYWDGKREDALIEKLSAARELK